MQLGRYPILAVMEKFTSTLEEFDSDVYSHGVIVPESIAQKFIQGTDRRVICELNDSHTFQSGLMPKGDGEYFVIINKDIRKKLGIKPGDEVTVSLQKDDSEFGMEFPLELKEALALEPLAEKHFKELTMGKQRNLIYIVNSAKRIETRIKKALIISSYLRDCGGKLDFRELNEAFRNANK